MKVEVEGVAGVGVGVAVGTGVGVGVAVGTGVGVGVAVGTGVGVGVAVGTGVGAGVGVGLGVAVGTGVGAGVGVGTGVGVGVAVGTSVGVAVGTGVGFSTALLDPIANTEKPGSVALKLTACAVSTRTSVSNLIQSENSSRSRYLNRLMAVGVRPSAASHSVANSNSTTDGKFEASSTPLTSMTR